MDAEQITEANRYYPLHNHSYIELVVYIASGSQCLRCPDVYSSTYLQCHFYPEYYNAHLYDIAVVGEPFQSMHTEAGKQQGQRNRHDDGQATGVASQQIGCLYLLFSYKMSNENGSTLTNGNGEEIHKEYHVPAIGACGKCFIAQYVDKKGDCHLRTAVAHFLASRW